MALQDVIPDPPGCSTQGSWAIIGGVSRSVKWRGWAAEPSCETDVFQWTGALRDAVKPVTPAGLHEFIENCKTITALSIFVP